MVMNEKITVYYENLEMYKEVFGQEGEEYWKIYLLNKQDGVSFEKLSMKFPYSASQIRRIVERVDKFLDAPEMAFGTRFLEGELRDDIILPNIFLPWNRTKVSLNAEKIFLVAINMVQNEMETIIPREFIVGLGAQYRNKERRIKLINELKSMQAMLDGKYYFDIFDDVVDVKGSFILLFSLIAIVAIDSVKLVAEQSRKGTDANY